MTDEMVELPSAAEVVKGQLRHAWLSSRWVFDDLDEVEYFWEPAPLCWSVRRRSPGVHGWGSGEFVCEDAFPAPEPLPVTTIAWRVIHLAAWTDIYRHWAFGDERPTLLDAEVPGDVSGGLAWLHDAQDQFMSAVDALDEVSIFEPRPAHWGESLPTVNLVTTMLTEHVHHIAEIGVLRDLHRGHARTRPRFTGA
jgi:DinB superfamily